MATKSLEGIKLYLEGKSGGGEIYLFLRIEGVNELSDTILSEFRSAPTSY